MLARRCGFISAAPLVVQASAIPLLTLGPGQHTLEWKEVRARVLQLGQQTLPIARDERVEYLGCKPLLVGGKQGSLHPLDNIVTSPEGWSSLAGT